MEDISSYDKQLLHFLKDDDDSEEVMEYNFVDNNKVDKRTSGNYSTNTKIISKPLLKEGEMFVSLGHFKFPSSARDVGYLPPNYNPVWTTLGRDGNIYFHSHYRHRHCGTIQKRQQPDDAHWYYYTYGCSQCDRTYVDPEWKKHCSN